LDEANGRKVAACVDAPPEQEWMVEETITKVKECSGKYDGPCRLAVHYTFSRDVWLEYFAYRPLYVQVCFKMQKI
jgi:hypothetical protein